MWTKLIEAIKAKDLEATRQFLAGNPACALERNYHDETPLHFAAEVGSLEISLELMKRGARTDFPDEFGWTPLHEACAKGHADLVDQFLATKPNLEGVSKKLETALHLATRKGFLTIVTALVKAGANHQTRNRNGDTPLHVGASGNRVDIMKVLLEAGADIAARNLNGETPLHLAAQEGHFEAAELLLSRGADPKEEDKRGRTFMEAAAKAGRMQFIGNFTALDDSPPPPAKGADPAPATPAAPAIRKTVMMKVQEMAEAVGAPEAQLLTAFLFGSVKKDKRHALAKLLDGVLWFIVFPFQLYLLWAGFHLKIIPGIVNIDARGEAALLLGQTVINTMIVFAITHYTVLSEKDSAPIQHFFPTLRRTVHFRVLQFALIDAFFYDKFTYDNPFWVTFFLFWTGFIFLHTFSFAFWWIDTRPPEE